MKDTQITYLFGRRDYAYEGYGSDGGSPTDPFVFSVHVSGVPSSWQSAYALLGFFRDDFSAACNAAKTSSEMSPIEGAELSIPRWYLDRPTIEADGKELLLKGKAPNPWLSRNK